MNVAHGDAAIVGGGQLREYRGAGGKSEYKKIQEFHWQKR
jgi:hypothetical protein